MAGNADEDRRRGEVEDEDRRRVKKQKKDEGNTSGGWKKGNDPFNLQDLAKSLPGNVDRSPQVPDRNLRMPASSSENVASDPTSGKNLPGNVASTTDILEKVDAGTRKRKPLVFNRVLWMSEKTDTSASRSENVAGDPIGTPTSSSENIASNVGGISLRRSSRLANPSGTPTSSSENTASEVGGISLRMTSKL